MSRPLYMFILLFTVDLATVPFQHRFSCALSNVAGDDGFGFMDLHELDHLRYEVEILPLPVKKEDVLKSDDRTGDESSVVVTSKRGQPYHCHLPDDKSVVDWSQSMDGGSGEDEILYTNIPSLLEPMKGNCLVMNEGWWTYKYCHGDSITQFHIEGGQIVGDIMYLGYYGNETVWTEEKLQKSMDRRVKNKKVDLNVIRLPSHDVHYVNGTLCELTDKPRSVSTKLTCSPYHTSSEIIRVVEEETCSYNLLVHTPFLCDHPLFVPDARLGLSTIRCSPILSEEKYERYMKSLISKKPKPIVVDKDEEDSTESKLSTVGGDRNTQVTKKDTIPLLDILEELSNSIVKEMSVEVHMEDEELDDEGKISKELDTLIENLVTDSLNKAFGISEEQTNSVDEDDELSNERSFPKGPESMKIGIKQDSKSAHTVKKKSFKNEGESIKGGEEQVKGKQKGVTDRGKDRGDVEGYKSKATIQKKKNKEGQVETEEENKQSHLRSTSSAASVLTSILHDILNDGYLEYSENTSSKDDDQKFEKKRRKLEERYEASWEDVTTSDEDNEE